MFIVTVCFIDFGQAESAYVGLILSLSQFLRLPQLPKKMKLPSKVVKIGLKIIISQQKSKSVKLTINWISNESSKIKIKYRYLLLMLLL